MGGGEAGRKVQARRAGSAATSGNAHVRVAVRDRPGPLTYITRGVYRSRIYESRPTSDTRSRQVGAGRRRLPGFGLLVVSRRRAVNEGSQSVFGGLSCVEDRPQDDDARRRRGAETRSAKYEVSRSRFLTRLLLVFFFSFFHFFFLDR